MLGAAAVSRAVGVEPELILYNANIHTIDPGNPEAQAVVIADGRFLAVGSNEDIRHLASARTKQIDLTGRCASAPCTEHTPRLKRT